MRVRSKLISITNPRSFSGSGDICLPLERGMGKDCSGLTTFLAAHASEGYRARIALVGFRGGKRGTVHLLANGVLYYFAGDLHEVALLARRTLALPMVIWRNPCIC